MRKTGVYVNVRTAVEPFRAFVPHPLPPVPPLALAPTDLTLLSEADRELGRLDGMSITLPDIAFFIDSYVRKEAVLSSQIEGTQSSLSGGIAARPVRNNPPLP